MKRTKYLCASLATALALTGMPLQAWAATVSPKPVLESHAESARAAKRSPARTGSVAPRAASERPPASFSEENRKRYAERDRKDQKSDEYKGGDGVYIGGGVIIVALVIVLVIVLVD